MVTIPAIRSRLDHIDTYAAEVEGNVEMITEFFAEHLGQLKAYGISLDNPMAMDILFKGLLAVPCEEFHRYIIDKEDMYYDGSLTLTPGEFVIMAHQRYMLMKTKGTFSKSLTSRKELIELRAKLNQVRSLTKNITQAATQLSSEEPSASIEPPHDPLPKDRLLPQEPAATRSSADGPTSAACTMKATGTLATAGTRTSACITKAVDTFTLQQQDHYTYPIDSGKSTAEDVLRDAHCKVHVLEGAPADNDTGRSSNATSHICIAEQQLHSLKIITTISLLSTMAPCH
jgi:hypothetical protein